MAEKPESPFSRAVLALTATEQRDKLIKAIIEKERADTDAKTARLKALRLARDAELSAQPEQPERKGKK